MCIRDRDAPVAFLGDTGAWKALPANLYYVFPNIYNTWEAGFKNNNRPISYKPRTGGVYQMCIRDRCCIMKASIMRFTPPAGRTVFIGFFPP